MKLYTCRLPLPLVPRHGEHMPTNRLSHILFSYIKSIFSL
jgi:hypothetical protein